MHQIGIRLKEHLLEKKITMTELSDLTGIPYNSITRMLNGESGMNSETLNKILESLPDINAKWLISGKGEKEILNYSEYRNTKSKLNEPIGVRLKKFLELSNMSYNDFAIKADIHYNSVTRMVNGETAMNSKTLNKVFSIFPDIDARWFITGEGEMEVDNSDIIKEDDSSYGDKLLDEKIKMILSNEIVIEALREIVKKYDEKNKI